MLSCYKRRGMPPLQVNFAFQTFLSLIPHECTPSFLNSFYLHLLDFLTLRRQIVSINLLFSELLLIKRNI